MQRANVSICICSCKYMTWILALFYVESRDGVLFRESFYVFVYSCVHLCFSVFFSIFPLSPFSICLHISFYLALVPELLIVPIVDFLTSPLFFIFHYRTRLGQHTYDLCVGWAFFFFFFFYIIIGVIMYFNNMWVCVYIHICMHTYTYAHVWLHAHHTYTPLFPYG